MVIELLHKLHLIIKRLPQTRAWYRIDRRQTYIKSHELEAWYAGLQITQNEVLSDYLLLIILTGLRRPEAATLKWSEVDLTAKTVTLVKTKNNETHTLPLSDFLYNLILNRKKNQTNDYVFPGAGAAERIRGQVYL